MHVQVSGEFILQHMNGGLDKVQYECLETCSAVE